MMLEATAQTSKRTSYPAYKDSGVEWLGDVPTHWEIIALRRSAKQVQTGSTPPTTEERFYENGSIPWYGPASFDNQIVVTRPVKMIHESAVHERVARCFAKGTTLMVTIGATLGKVSSLGAKGSCNQQITAIEFDPKVLYPRFATYQIKRLEPIFRTVAPRATLPILDQNEIADTILALPPLREQEIIAAFLDRQTEKIDTLVAKKRTLIERLKEERTALITHTVTRGLPPEAARAAGLEPHPKLKSSGVEWLGDVPTHWEICKLKRVTISRCDGPFGSSLKSAHYSDAGVRVIRLQNIRFAQFDDLDAAFIEPEYYEELGDHNVLPYDLLIAGLGDENYPVGRACVAPSTLGPAMVKADCFRFRLMPNRANSAYVALQLSTIANSLAGALATGTTRGRMNLVTTENRDIALPPLSEQVAVADFLDCKTAKIDTLVTKIETAIERLQEYRSALITAAVTGKIDMREEAVL